MNFYKTYLLLITVAISLDCANTEKVNDKSSIDVILTKVDAWLNLMPGTSPRKFHLQGEIKLANTNAKDITNLNLNSITVYTNEDIVYNFKPYFSVLAEEESLSLNKNSSKEFVFGTASGMTIDPRLTENNVIDVKLNFTFDKENFIYDLNAVNIMKVY